MVSKYIRYGSLVLMALTLAAAAPAGGGTDQAAAEGDGVVRIRSAYAMDETIDRLKQDVAAKGITFFTAIDQSKLAADAGVPLRPSTLLVFGNPPLGAQFITSNAMAGLGLRVW